MSRAGTSSGRPRRPSSAQTADCSVSILRKKERKVVQKQFKHVWKHIWKKSVDVQKGRIHKNNGCNFEYV